MENMNNEREQGETYLFLTIILKIFLGFNLSHKFKTFKSIHLKHYSIWQFCFNILEYLVGFRYKSAVLSHCTFKYVSRKHTFLAIYNSVFNQIARYLRRQKEEYRGTMN